MHREKERQKEDIEKIQSGVNRDMQWLQEEIDLNQQHIQTCKAEQKLNQLKLQRDPDNEQLQKQKVEIASELKQRKSELAELNHRKDSIKKTSRDAVKQLEDKFKYQIDRLTTLLKMREDHSKNVEEELKRLTMRQDLDQE